MALGRSNPRRFSYRNLLSSSVFPPLSLDLSCNPTSDPAPVPALAPALVAINELFKQFMKAYLELNQRPRQPLAECEQVLKA